MNALFEHAGNGVDAGFIALFFNGRQGKVQRLFSNHLMLLAHGIDGQWQKVQQLRVTKGGQTQRRFMFWMLQQRIEHALQ